MKQICLPAMARSLDVGKGAYKYGNVEIGKYANVLYQGVPIVIRGMKKQGWTYRFAGKTN
jgi:hypothetical protein